MTFRDSFSDFHLVESDAIELRPTLLMYDQLSDGPGFSTSKQVLDLWSEAIAYLSQLGRPCSLQELMDLMFEWARSPATIHLGPGEDNDELDYEELPPECLMAVDEASEVCLEAATASAGGFQDIVPSMLNLFNSQVQRLQLTSAQTMPLLFELMGRLSIRGLKKVLFVSSDPEPNSRAQASNNEWFCRTRSSRELAAIRKKFWPDNWRNGWHLVDCPFPSKEYLMRHLKEYSPTILHIASHGVKEGGIVLEKPHGGPDILLVSELIKMLEQTRTHIGLECVILSVCDSVDTAKRLVGANVSRHAIGFSYRVEAEQADAFSAAFYEHFLTTENVRVAFKQAIGELGWSEGRSPQLFPRN